DPHRPPWSAVRPTDRSGVVRPRQAGPPEPCRAALPAEWIGTERSGRPAASEVPTPRRSRMPAAARPIRLPFPLAQEACSPATGPPARAREAVRVPGGTREDRDDVAPATGAVTSLRASRGRTGIRSDPDPE